MNSKIFSPAGWIWYSRPLLALIMFVMSLYLGFQGRGTTWSWVLGAFGLVLLVLNGFLIYVHKKSGKLYPWEKAPDAQQ